jgi:predicted NUDIX family NTP pyrophosphohydrolase
MLIVVGSDDAAVFCSQSKARELSDRPEPRHDLHKVALTAEIDAKKEPWRNPPMTKRSAGILLFRKSHGGVELLLAHPGGPFWASKDAGVWSIPKGEYDETEDAQTAARREVWEETGIVVSGQLIELGTYRQPSGKLVSAWATEGDFDPKDLKSNNCQVEWPPKSGRLIDVPEIDRTAWFSIEDALTKITKGQLPIVQALAKKLSDGAGERETGV